MNRRKREGLLYLISRLAGDRGGGRVKRMKREGILHPIPRLHGERGGRVKRRNRYKFTLSLSQIGWFSSSYSQIGW